MTAKIAARKPEPKKDLDMSTLWGGGAAPGDTHPHT